MYDRFMQFLEKIRRNSIEIENNYIEEIYNMPSRMGYGGSLSEYITEILDILHSNNSYIISQDILMEQLIKEFNIEDYDANKPIEYYQQLCQFFGVKNYGKSNTSKYLEVIRRKLPIDFGQEMEQLYFNDNFIVGVHGTTLDSDLIEEEIFKNGLLCNHGNDLKGTVALKNNGLAFDQFISYVYKVYGQGNTVIVCVPIEEIQSPMWRKIDTNACMLNPKYVYGYYLSTIDASFNENPIIIHNPNYSLSNNDEYYDIEDVELSLLEHPISK